MKKINLVLILAITLFLAIASASMLIPADENAKEHAQAPENSPVIGEDWEIERVDFIHYVKPGLAGSGKAETCYKLMGVKWTILPVSYTINPGNPQNLTEPFVTSAIAVSAETWDTYTSSELFNNLYTIDYTAQYGIQDYNNVIAFGLYPDNNVIAVTSVWFTRIGKRIVEFDQLYNTYFLWGDATLNPSVMDLQNVATHELGHAVGLGDLYNSPCSQVTMFGYSSYGETSKRSLEQPDITGLQKLYRA